MAIDFTSSGGIILKTLTTGLFWFVLAIVMLIGVFGALWIRKKRKLQYPALILSDLGSGKMGIEYSKAGWFKSRSTFFGLWDYGKEEYLKLKDGRRVQAASTVDFHDLNKRRGLVVFRKSDDNLIVVPIEKMKIVNNELILKVAPADFRDAAVSIVQQAEKETRNKMEQLIQWLIFGGVIIFALVSIILITQMVQRGQMEAANLIREVAINGCNSPNVQAAISNAP